MKSAFAIIIAVMAAACSEDAVPVAADTIDVVLDGVIAGYSADDTKAAAQNVVRVMWKGGEEVQVYGGKTYLGCLTASVTGTDSTYAKLSGTILAPDEGKPVTLLYDNVAEPVLFPDGRISLDFSVQEGEDAHFAMYASLPSLEGTRNGNNASVSNLKVPFKLATAIFKCNCTCLPQAEECEAVISDVNTECVITLSDTAGPAVNGSGRGTITVKCGAVSPYKGVTFSVGLPPAPAAASRSIVMTAVDEHYDASFPKNAFESSKAYNSLFLFAKRDPVIDAVLRGRLLTGEFTVADGRKVRFSGGNLWYDGSRFRFESDQYISSPSAAGGRDESHISHFTWCSDAAKAVALTYDDTMYPDGLFANYMKIYNIKGWFAPSHSDLMALIHTRTASTVCGVENARWFKGRITTDGSAYVNGLFLIPDIFTWPEEVTTTPAESINNSNAVFRTVDFTIDEYNILKEAGLVFLPAAGSRNASEGSSAVTDVNVLGYYWVDNIPQDSYAEQFSFSTSAIFPSSQGYAMNDRSFAQSVRLMLEVKE